jgi:hypothetical protein
MEDAGFEGHIVELSWYGDRDVRLPLGGRFHQARLRISSSQVGNVATSQRARWSYRRRMQLALRLLADSRYDRLLGEPVDFVDLPRRLPEWLGAGSQVGSAVAQLVRYR